MHPSRWASFRRPSFQNPSCPNPSCHLASCRTASSDTSCRGPCHLASSRDPLTAVHAAWHRSGPRLALHTLCRRRLDRNQRGAGGNNGRPKKFSSAHILPPLDLVPRGPLRDIDPDQISLGRFTPSLCV